MSAAMRDVESSVARQARLVSEAGPGAPDEASASELERHVSALRLDAVTSRTPAQMARRLGLDQKWLAELLARRSGIRMSDGALHGDTYTGTDMDVFDDATKGHLFDWIVEEVGAEKVAASAEGVGPDWWNTQGGKLFESLASMADVSVGHETKDREPIPRWQARIVWLGLLGTILATVVSVGILIVLAFVWRGSYLGWRDGSRSSPRAAVVLGVLTAALLVAGLVALVLSSVAWRVA